MPRKLPSELQRQEIEEVRLAGGHSDVVESVDETLTYICYHLQQSGKLSEESREVLSSSKYRGVILRTGYGKDLDYRWSDREASRKKRNTSSIDSRSTIKSGIKLGKANKDKTTKGKAVPGRRETARLQR